MNNMKKGNMIQFLQALAKAVEKNERTFTCPLCGGVAKWTAAPNGHKHAACTECPIRVME